MKDEYTSIFYDIVKESQDRTGYSLPDHVEAYVVMLLASYVERPDFLPTDSFGETFLKLRRPADYTAKELGDTCLFVSGVFPSYGSKHGINRRYYQDIGSTSYEMVSEVMNRKLFATLSAHFVFVSEFIETTVHCSKGAQKILFR